MPNDPNMQEYAPVDDALSLLTGTEGGEGDLARGITREGVTTAMLADTAAREEHTRTPVATTTTAVSSNGATSTTETNLSADAERVRASAGSLADSFNNAHNTTTTAATDAAAAGQPAATATETTAATTGTEQTTTEPVVEGYDPNQPIILKDGVRTTLGQVEHGTLLKSRYDAMVTNLQKQERDLKAKQDVVDRNVEYLQAMENDPFGAVYVTARKNGSTPEQAAKAAAEAAGLTFTAPHVESGPPQPGSERYYLTPYTELGVVPGTPEYDAWFTGNADATLKKRMEDERATTLKAIDDRLSKFAPAQQETEEQKKTREVRAEFFASNKEMLRTLPNAILSVYKIDVNALPETGRQKVQTALEQTLADKKMWVGTQEWMENNVLTESDIENVVLRTNIPTVLNGAARTNGAATNGSTGGTNGSTNGSTNGAATAQPQLVRPNVDRSVTTISALPSGDGAVPVSPMYQGNPDNQYLEDALDLLHA